MVGEVMVTGSPPQIVAHCEEMRLCNAYSESLITRGTPEPTSVLREPPTVPG